ncbi:DUF3016 domain-containing protein [Rheinheimera sp. MM224]|uniref:DUF3016 domain-containing protein n=1 Tax=Rheinheimera sp. MM224 TaxID=3019969 RepID=UPI0021F84A0A|nr:DUF3016 domain-containing protein [Rheinheimera sp. MM224]CAI3792740.1 hypothetical protein JAMGFMIE_00634 [Rheinheimera sp. MM224]
MRFIKSGVLMLSLLVAGTAAAAEVKVEYKDYKKFTDMKPANEARGGFEKRTMASFDKIFADLAKDLPEGYSWNVVVTDIDLAGDVNHMYTQSGDRIRVIKDIFIPRINFSYTLLDKNKAVVAEEKELKLKDMGFMTRLNVSRADRPLEHERAMLQRWYKDTIQPAVASHQQNIAKAG